MPSMSDDDLVSVLQHMADLSAPRSELSAERSYQNAERNLSLLTHSAAALMILGLSVDRYLLHVRGLAPPASMAAGMRTLSVGASMVAIGALAVLLGGLRYLPYVRAYHRNPRLYPGRSAYLPPAFALLTGCGGIVLLFYMRLVMR